LHPQAALRSLLAEPVVDACATDQLHRIKFLALRNLGDLLARRPYDPDSTAAALLAYCKATEVDADDGGLWNKLGTLVRRLLGAVAVVADGGKAAHAASPWLLAAVAKLYSCVP
jgi:hypothetical protein